MNIAPANTTPYDTKPLEGNIYTQRSNNPFGDIKARLEEIIENIISGENQLSVTDEINQKFLNLDFESEFDIDATKIGTLDASFFLNLLSQNQTITYSVQDNKIELVSGEKEIKVTNPLLDVLRTSVEKNRPIRLDFDRDVTVILRMDKEGKVQAHFIPGTPEVESYLKNNIPILKQAFDEKDINYSYLGYSEQRNKKRKKEQ